MAALVAPMPTARREPKTLERSQCALCVRDLQTRRIVCDLTGACVEGADEPGRKPAFCPLVLPAGRAGQVAAATVCKLARRRGKARLLERCWAGKWDVMA